MVTPDYFLSQLRAFYERERIDVKGFQCPHFGECSIDAQPRNLLMGAEAHVGSSHAKVTRVVVISLDIGNEKVPINRELVGRRDVIESIVPNEANPHMRGTLETLVQLLGPEIGSALPWPYFAMLNSSKCSDSGTMAKVPDRLYERCRPFARREIELLEPDILVAQGKTAKRVLGPTRKVSDTETGPLFQKLEISTASPVQQWLSAVVSEYVSFATVGAREVVAMATPHPSDQGGRWHLFQRINLPICSWVVRYARTKTEAHESIAHPTTTSVARSPLPASKPARHAQVALAFSNGYVRNKYHPMKIQSASSIQ